MSKLIVVTGKGIHSDVEKDPYVSKDLGILKYSVPEFIKNNKNFEIIPGQLMTVKIIYDEVVQIGVPESAVTIQGSTAFVYTVKDDTAEKKDIKIGKRNFGKVSVISGINEGDFVITEGVSKVRNNAKIKIINPRN